MAEVETIINEPSEAEKRIKQLSGAVKASAEERDAAKAAAEASEAKAVDAERTAKFYESFADMVSTNPAAKDHKEDILSKVKSGYTVEDATFAVLGKAGKLGSPKVETQVIAGGSAINQIQQPTEKTAETMTQAERREALMADEATLQRILSPRQQ